MAGMEGLTGETAHAGNMRNRGFVQWPCGQDYAARQQWLPSVQINLPALLVRKPAQGHHVGMETNQRAQRIVIGDAQNIVLNFLLLRVRSRPVHVGRKRKGIQVRRHVAGAAGIDVVPPGASHFATSLQYCQRLCAARPHTNGGTQATKPSPHNGHIDYFHATNLTQPDQILKPLSVTWVSLVTQSKFRDPNAHGSIAAGPSTFGASLRPLVCALHWVTRW